MNAENIPRAVNGVMPVRSWREQAEAMFFKDHMKTTDIAVVVGKARETVSRHIAGLPGYEDEMAERARWALERRREYQRGWDREHRARYVPDADAASLRREHELAAIELSREQYYG